MKISDRQIDAFLRTPDPAIRAVLLFGPDTGKIKEFADGLGHTVLPSFDDPFRLADLTGAQLRDDPARLADEAAALSLTGGRRLIRVRDAGDGNTDIFENMLQHVQGDFLVVAEAGTLAAGSKLRKLFEGAKNAAAIACYADEERDLRSLVRGHLQQAKIRCGDDVIAFLADHLGADRLLTRMELDKLILYVGENGTVSLEEARQAIGDNAALRLDDIVFAMAEGEPESLDRALTRARAEGMNFQPVLRAAQQHLRVLHLAGNLVAGGQSIDAAFKAAGFRGALWKVSDRLARQLRGWPANRLTEAMNRLVEAEMQCKTTGLPADAITGQTLLGIALSARNRSRAGGARA